MIAPGGYSVGSYFKEETDAEGNSYWRKDTYKFTEGKKPGLEDCYLPGPNAANDFDYFYGTLGKGFAEFYGSFTEKHRIFRPGVYRSCDGGKTRPKPDETQLPLIRWIDYKNTRRGDI